MTTGPNNVALGEVLQPLKPTERGVHYHVGQPVEYESIYGHPKRRFPVFSVDPHTGVQGDCIGWIKQEPLADEMGNLAGFAYYTKEGWRNNGQFRFYASPEALLAAYGMAVFAGEVLGAEGMKQLSDSMAEAATNGEPDQPYNQTTDITNAAADMATQLKAMGFNVIDDVGLLVGQTDLPPGPAADGPVQEHSVDSGQGQTHDPND